MILRGLCMWSKRVEFAAAGRADEPKSKLSRIAQLEEQFGRALIQRTTRQFNVTEVGQTFYEHCKERCWWKLRRRRMPLPHCR